MAKIYSSAEALEKMKQICSRAEHSSREIKDKLRKFGLGTSDIHTILMWLIGNRYIDDGRFAEAFVRDKYMFGKWGRRKIAYALSAKGIDRQDIDKAFEVIDEEEYLLIAKKLARAKARGATDMTYEDKNKIYRWLLSRGFESGVASAAVKEMLNPEF